VLWGNSSTTTVSTSWIQRIQILLDVADALAYLHLIHKSIHQDLKSPNILLERVVSNDAATRSDKSVTHRAKLADFGLSKIFQDGKKRLATREDMKNESSAKAIKAANWTGIKQKGFVGTPRWMAPEMMVGSVKIGPSVDIYSFGVVMWEVWAQRKPWSELSDKREIFKVVKEEKRNLPSLKKKNENDVPEGYDTLMKRCYEYEFKKRPLIDFVRSQLQILTESAARLDCLKKTAYAATSHANEEKNGDSNDAVDVENAMMGLELTTLTH
jgi:serine/threonine protein kinase